MPRSSAAARRKSAHKRNVSCCNNSVLRPRSRSTTPPSPSSGNSSFLKGGSVMFRGVMRLLLLLALLPVAAGAEIKDRIAAVVNGHPITLSEVEERVAPELARAAAGPAGDAQRREILKHALDQLIDEQLVASEASALGIDVSDDELEHPVEQLARENRMDMAQFRQALAQQGMSMETVRDSLKRQQLTIRLLQYKVKPRRVSDEEVQAAYANMTRNAEHEVRARHLHLRAARRDRCSTERRPGESGRGPPPHMGRRERLQGGARRLRQCPSQGRW